jgi:hypothetical protein
MGDARALVHCDLGGDGKLALQRADDQEAHVSISFLVFLSEPGEERVANSRSPFAIR